MKEIRETAFQLSVMALLVFGAAILIAFAVPGGGQAIERLLIATSISGLAALLLWKPSSQGTPMPPTKSVYCAYRGCTEVVEVLLYDDEMQYCAHHTKKVAQAWEAMHQKQRELRNG